MEAFYCTYSISDRYQIVRFGSSAYSPNPDFELREEKTAVGLMHRMPNLCEG